MVNADVVAFNVAVFIATLFLLESGADKFIDHTIIVARRTGTSEAIIGLLTAGAEWEELAVVVASLAHQRASLAMGNIVGSAISNILGAFSLGLVVHRGNACSTMEFDRASRIYSALLLVLTTFFVPVVYSRNRTVWLACGAVLIASFAMYIVSVGWAVSRGHLTAPENSDSNSDSESDSGSGSDPNDDSDDAASEGRSNVDIHCSGDVNDATPLLGRPRPARSGSRSITYHICHLLLGFLSIALAGYILSHAATAITDEFGLSDVLFGVVVLAIATTLPEKFVAVISGHRGAIGVLVANTVGSNIFLLSLCAGIVMLDTSGDFDNKGNVTLAELCALWGSTLAFTLTVWFGEEWYKWSGVAMLACYIAFIVLEFTVIHKV